MFRKSLKEKLERIFGLPKVTFDAPGETKEQEGVFIQIDDAVSRVKKGRAIVKAQGVIAIFANAEKLPFGFFNKRLENADASDTADLFFYDIDTNIKYYQNLVERQCKFVYFFNQEYDPEAGEITSLTLSEEDE